ncbi:hypothetical protein MVEN_00105600 [Mycena venus]|uniref:Uncharacterized protein n=1 Tax=Mycena venus TaxID=2733690 RepID=A0A8H6Z510_9AGAR|nr:hypothetical protein MVEN_00105600 [Mycena venus]
MASMYAAHREDLKQVELNKLWMMVDPGFQDRLAEDVEAQFAACLGLRTSWYYARETVDGGSLRFCYTASGEGYVMPNNPKDPLPMAIWHAAVAADAAEAKADEAGVTDDASWESALKAVMELRWLQGLAVLPDRNTLPPSLSLHPLPGLHRRATLSCGLTTTSPICSPPTRTMFHRLLPLPFSSSPTSSMITAEGGEACDVFEDLEEGQRPCKRIHTDY